MIQAEASQSNVIHCVSDSQYYSAIESAGNRLVVVDCYAPWCPPCQKIAPVFEQLAKTEYTDVVFIKIDMDQASPKLKSVMSVWALPTFVFLRQGKKVGSFMGANEKSLREGLEHDGRVSMCSTISCSIQ